MTKVITFNAPMSTSSGLSLYGIHPSSYTNNHTVYGWLFKPKKDIVIKNIKHLFWSTASPGGTINQINITSKIYLIEDNDLDNKVLLNGKGFNYLTFDGGETKELDFQYDDTLLEQGKNYMITIGRYDLGTYHGTAIGVRVGQGSFLSDTTDIDVSEESFNYNGGQISGNKAVLMNGSYPISDRHRDLVIGSKDSNVYMEITYELANNNPTVNVTSPTPNQTLYENDTLIIDGSAIDNDADQSVTVYYQINDGPKKVLATNLSQTTIPFNKQLKFNGGKFYDGETAVSGDLVDGVAHTLKVWAQDSEGAMSTPQTRTFYVVPNRAPTLTIEPITPSGNIDTDKFTVTGHAGDPDANANVTVTYRINENNSVEIYNGPGGAFSFDIALGQLVVGQNTIVVEVIDNYGAKTSKTIKLNKNEIKTPLLKSTARFKLEPPAGSAKGVLLYIRRDQNLAIDTKISMTLKGEPENFVPMQKTNFAPMPDDPTILEDEFYYETTEAKDNIIVQVDMIRESFDVSDTITLIQGAFE